MRRCKGENKNGGKCRKEAKQGHYCWSCQKRAYAKRHPEKYAFQTLKNNVKRRNKKRIALGKKPIPFNITLDDFIEFAVAVDYMNKRGTSKTSYHIDRIADDGSDDPIGYTKGNLQALTNSQNVKKYYACINGSYNWTTGQMEFTTTKQAFFGIPDSEIDPECGF